MTAIVELRNATKLVKSDFDEEKIILNDVSLDIHEHDFITILGGNGAGKSTLFNVIAGTLPLTSGSIHILGENVTHFHQKSGPSTCPVSFRILRWERLRG